MKTTSLIIILSIFLLFNHNSYPQVNMEWVGRYDGNYSQGNRYDNATAIALDGSGNVYVTGQSLMNAGMYNYATVKYNSSGVQQWVMPYDGTGGTDGATSIAIDPSGNIYVTGASFSQTTDNDFATIKYDPSGNQLWVQRYDGPASSGDKANSIKVDANGNVYVTGHSMGIGTGYDYATIKYNTDGVQQWLQRFNGPGHGDDVPYMLALDNSGNVYVTGYSMGSGTGRDFATVKYNSMGVEQWVQRYNGDGNGLDEAHAIVLDNSGNVLVTGQSAGNGTGNDFATVKYNSSGVRQWVQRYNSGGNTDDGSTSVGVDASGNSYVTGSNFTTIKYNSSGVLQWVRVMGGGTANSIAVDDGGNCYITGDHYITIKYNTSGDQQWTQTYGGVIGSVAIALDASGSVYVTGTRWTTSTNPDYITIKYSQLLGIQPISSETPNKFSLSQNYPNPFNPSTIIRFAVPLNKGGNRGLFVLLKIYDILGSEVTTLVNEKLQPGKYEINFDVSKYSSGVYYYKLSAGDFIETKKMILIK